MSSSPNPFPSSAVAQLSEQSIKYLHIETNTVSKGKERVRDYFVKVKSNAGQGTLGFGQAIAVVGDYGAGKTHLIRELISELSSLELKDKYSHIHKISIDVAIYPLVSLLQKQLLPTINRDGLVNLVQNLLANIIASDILDSPLTRPLGEKLNRGDINPLVYLKESGSDDTAYFDALKKQLNSFCRRTIVPEALIHLVNPALEKDIWDWLMSKEPSPLLQEYGVRERLENDYDAVDLLQAILGLMHCQGYVMVLFIDEAEKLFPTKADMSQGIELEELGPVKLLTEALIHWNGLLVLSGLPEFWDRVKPEVKDRFLSVLKPGMLSVDEVKSYIRKANSKVTREETLRPFTDSSVTYLRDAVRGNPRRVIRLCYNCFHEAASRGKDRIDPEMIRHVMRDQFEVISPEGIMDEISKILDAQDLRYEIGLDVYADRIVSEASIGRRKVGRIDFRVFLENGDAVLDVIVTQSILKQADVNKVSRILDNSLNLKEANSRKHFYLLIVNGYYISDLLNPIKAKIAKIHTFKADRAFEFSYGLAEILSTLRKEVKDDTVTSGLNDLKTELSSLVQSIEILNSRVRKEDKLSRTAREVRTIARQVTEDVFNRFNAETPDQFSLPEPIRLRFNKVENLLRLLRSLQIRILDIAFGSDMYARGMSRRYSRIRKLAIRSFSSDTDSGNKSYDDLEAIFWMSILVERFKHRINEVFASAELARNYKECVSDLNVACSGYSSLISQYEDASSSGFEHRFFEYQRLLYEISNTSYGDTEEQIKLFSENLADINSQMESLLNLGEDIHALGRKELSNKSD